MEIIPAIDLIDGRCVRLRQGDYEQVTHYETPALELARQYAEAGARWLHVVDLDGAREGRQGNRELVAKLAAESGLKVQTGGGVRSGEDVEALLGAGVQRVVISSVAVRQPEMVREWIGQHGGDRIVLALDVRWVETEYRVAVSGWSETAQLSLWAALGKYRGADVRHVLCTDISRDGMMNGPNVMLYRELVDRMPKLSVQASGGVRNEDDLKQLRQTHARGAIVGKALLDGTLPMSALARVKGRRR